ARTMPTVVCERLTDGVAMLGLASVGLVLFGYGWQPLAAIAVLAVVIVAVVQYRPPAGAIPHAGEGIPVLGQAVGHPPEFCAGAYALLALRPLALAIGMGLVSWAGECVAFYLVLRGLGMTGDTLLVAAFFVLAVSTLVGSLSLLPGGLGVADASITGLLLAVT